MGIMAGKAALALTCVFGVFMAGCGALPFPAAEGDSVNTVVSGDEATAGQPLDPCDGDRVLRLTVVFEGASLARPLDLLDLAEGQVLPPFDPAALGVSPDDRDRLASRIVALVSEAYAPFGLFVSGDSGVDDATLGGEEIARIIVTQVEGGPRRCACQGATAELGLAEGGAAEGVVLANAFNHNGFADAIAGFKSDEQIEMAAVVLSNSIVHEAGHTLGLVHIDVPGPPVYYMARGGDAQSSLPLTVMTRVQSFSDREFPVTPDARNVRAMQCDTCVIRETIEQRRQCTSFAFGG